MIFFIYLFWEQFQWRAINKFTYLHSCSLLMSILSCCEIGVLFLWSFHFFSIFQQSDPHAISLHEFFRHRNLFHNAQPLLHSWWFLFGTQLGCVGLLKAIKFFLNQIFVFFLSYVKCKTTPNCGLHVLGISFRINIFLKFIAVSCYLLSEPKNS